MSRLIVDAVSSEYVNAGSESEYSLKVLVSVSYSESGLPLTGLRLENFSVTGNQDAKVEDGNVLECTGLKERPVTSDGSFKHSGIYELECRSFQVIDGKTVTKDLPFARRYYAFGIQIAFTGGRNHEAYHGQTVVSVYNN